MSFSILWMPGSIVFTTYLIALSRVSSCISQLHRVCMGLHDNIAASPYSSIACRLCNALIFSHFVASHIIGQELRQGGGFPNVVCGPNFAVCLCLSPPTCWALMLKLCSHVMIRDQDRRSHYVSNPKSSATFCEKKQEKKKLPGDGNSKCGS